jgi:hypothetical protein
MCVKLFLIVKLVTGANVRLVDKRGASCLLTALTNLTPVHFGGALSAKRNAPRELDQASEITKVSVLDKIL